MFSIYASLLLNFKHQSYEYSDTYFGGGTLTLGQVSC